MNYNSILNALKKWCIDKENVYQRVYEQMKGSTSIGYYTTGELQFKLSMLIDKEFSNQDEFHSKVLSLLDVHYDHTLQNLTNEIEKFIVDKIKQEFRTYLDEILQSQDWSADTAFPYERIIIDEEAATITERFRKIWKYENTDYWYPLCGDEPAEIADKFFIMYDYIKPYMSQLNAWFKLPEKHLYSCFESAYSLKYCTETDSIDAYGGEEVAYTDKDFTFIIYFSHENTVAFAGSIVPFVKELLKDEEEHWNRFEW